MSQREQTIEDSPDQSHEDDGEMEFDISRVEIDPEDIIERNRGILTKDDRKFLLGQKELSEQASRNARFRIRDRVVNALLDFNLLTRSLENESNFEIDDREQIFKKVKENELLGPTPVSHFAFLYGGFYDVTNGPEDTDELLYNFLESAVDKIEQNERDTIANVDLSIERKEPDIDALLNRIAGNHADINELIYFLSQADPDTAKQLLDEVSRREDIMVEFRGEEISIKALLESIGKTFQEATEEDQADLDAFGE